MSSIAYKPEHIYELVHKIDLIIPEDAPHFENLKQNMNSLKESLKWTAPEVLYRRWNDLYEILNDVPPDSEMEQQIKEFFKTIGTNEAS